MPPRRGRRVAATAALALLVAGCATEPPHSTRSTPLPSEPPVDRPSPEPTPKPIAIPEASAAHADYVPQAWRDPSADLWAQVRDELSLHPHAKRRDVRQWTQYYATHQGHVDASLERAQPYLWHVVQEIDARDLPGELALLPIVESGYNASARSYVGASGLWQFMPGTADHVGLARDWWYDGRNDVIASTDAALDYLEMLLARYDGDWLLALAAYNAGPGRVDSALERAAAESIPPDYWRLELPRETTEYVPKLLAIRRILVSPRRFGITWPSLDNEARTRAVTLSKQVEISVAADMLNMSETALRRLNPGMRRWASTPDGGRTLLVPADKAAAFSRQLAAAEPSELIHRRTHTVRRGEILGRIANAYRVSVPALRQANHLTGDRIRAGQTLQIPQTGDAPPAEPTQSYVVQSGDTLWDIAHRYNVAVPALQRANPDVGTLRAGASLTIPGAATPPAPTTHVVQHGESLWSIADANDVAIADLRRWNRLEPEAELQPGRELAVDGAAPLPDFYEVESGDSLWSIASRFSMRVTTLRSLNDMSSNSTIQPGQRLRLQPAVSS